MVVSGERFHAHGRRLLVGASTCSHERKLSNHNAALWSTLALAPVQRMTYKGADGWDVDGFLVKPLNWQPGRTYPLVLSIHGGPAGQYGVDWFHEFQVYAAHGWAVFFTNPRGSTGYGREFQRGIENEWGGKDYIDIMNGLDAAIAANAVDRHDEASASPAAATAAT